MVWIKDARQYLPPEDAHKTLLGFCYARAAALRNVFKG